MADSTEDLAMKILQLECIIDAKDREIQILREQASQDPEELIEQLQEQNDTLSQQLSKLRAASNTTHGSPAQAAAGNSLTRALKQAVTDAAHVIEGSAAALQQLLQALQRAGDAPASEVSDTPTAVSAGNSRDKLLQLNVSGSQMVVQLSVLQQVPNSRLAAMFTFQGSEQQQQQQQQQQHLLYDQDGRYYLPFEPAAFRKILSVLQARSIFSSSSSCCCYLQPPAASPPPPAAAAAAVSTADAGNTDWEYLLQLVEYLGLQDLLPDYTAAAAGSNTECSPQQRSSSSSSSNGSIQRSGSSSNSSSRAQRVSQAAGQRPKAHQAVSDRQGDKSSNTAAFAEPVQAAAVNSQAVPATAAAAAALHALPARQTSLGPDSNPAAAAAPAPASNVSATAGDTSPSQPVPAAAAAHAAAMQALLPKRSDGGALSDPGDAAAAAARAAAPQGKLQHRTLSHHNREQQ